MTLLEVIQVEKLPDFKGGFIFNTPEFQLLKTGEHLNFVLKEKDIVVARVWFNIHDTKAISGHKATFGSIDHHEEVTVKSMQCFVHQVIDKLKRAGIKEVIIKHWPQAYYTNDIIPKALV